MPVHAPPVAASYHPRVRAAARAAGTWLLLGCALTSTGAAQEGPPARAAQESPARPLPDSSQAPGSWLASFVIGVPGTGASAVPELFTLGGQWTQVRPGRPGLDIAVGTMLRALPEGAVVVGARAGVVLPIVAAPGMLLLLPSVGVSGIGGAGAGGAALTQGVNGGISALVGGRGGPGIRTGITWHLLTDLRRPIWLLEMGIVGGTP